jgi:ankyrin repeat protein
MSKTRPEWYELRDALAAEDFATADLLLRARPSLLDERNGIGETVLHFLAVEDCLPGVKWLHSRGSSLNTTNGFGRPVLFEVAQLGHRDLFVWLVRHGANVSQEDREGRTLREYLTLFNKAEMVALVDDHAP